jgi:hypothetical protein
MTPLERLLAIEEIRQLKARYFRCVDSKDWDGLAALFAPDACFDRRGAVNLFDPWNRTFTPPLAEEPDVRVGREAIVRMVREAVEHLHTVHHGHIPEIEILDERTARGLWPMEDELRDRERRLVLRGRGHYHETYERLPAGWAIKTTRITRLALERGDGAADPTG